MYNLRHNLWQFLICLDQIFNVLLAFVTGRKSYADMTLSAMAWYWHLENKYSFVYRIIDTIFFFDKQHCYSAYLAEKDRIHTPFLKA